MVILFIVIFVMMVVGCGGFDFEDLGFDLMVEGFGKGVILDDLDVDDGDESGVGVNVDGVIELFVENMMIQFVGCYIDKLKDDCMGGFLEFFGMFEMDVENVNFILFMLDINIEFVWILIEGFMNYLKSFDFFNICENFKVMFVFFKIEVGVLVGDYNVIGMLMLFGNENIVFFFMKIFGEGDEMKMIVSFDIDWMDFGMDYGLDQIELNVIIMFEIG